MQSIGGRTWYSIVSFHGIPRSSAMCYVVRGTLIVWKRVVYHVAKSRDAVAHSYCGCLGPTIEACLASALDIKLRRIFCWLSGDFYHLWDGNNIIWSSDVFYELFSFFVDWYAIGRINMNVRILDVDIIWCFSLPSSIMGANTQLYHSLSV